MSSQVSDAPRRGLNARQADTVGRLLTAGLEEVRAVGHDALTMRTVAQRAGVSPATAYTYLASKNHLFAELFWRHLAETPTPEIGQAQPPSTASRPRRGSRRPDHRGARAGCRGDPCAARHRPGRRAAAAADRRRVRDPVRGRATDPAEPTAHRTVLDVLVMTFSGALLQAGMGLMTYAEMADRLEAAVAVII